MQRNEIQSYSNFLPKRNHLIGVFFNLILFVTVFMSTLVQAQNPSAIVEFESTEKGILIPRMTGNEIVGIVSAVEGLMVYNTDTHQFFYHNGTDWQAFPSGAKGDQGPRGQKGISIDTVFVIEGIPSPLKSIVIEYSDQSMDTLANALIPGPAGEKGDDGVGIAQTISLMGDSLALSDGGGKVGLDTSNTNEKITALAVVGDSLLITEGGMTMKVAVDSSNVNELQLLTLEADSIVLSGGGGKVGIDTSNTNEKITGFGIVGDSLYIKEGSMDTMKVKLPDEIDPKVPIGTAVGEMQYWNGTDWVIVAATVNNGATLQMIGGVPTWVGGTPPLASGEVYNPTTGKIWMDRNLGATQVATDSADYLAYGDLYQWGRGSDGHQIRTSDTTSTIAYTAVPNANNSWDSLFITEEFSEFSPVDWLTPQDSNLWQGLSGTNNPCPTGYRIPTEEEWDAERASWGTNENSTGAFASPLKLPMAGHRSSSDGSLSSVGTRGRYWSSTVSGADARRLSFTSSTASMGTSVRAGGRSVRCIKD